MRARVFQLICDGVSRGVAAAESGWRDLGRVDVFTEFDHGEVVEMVRAKHPFFRDRRSG